GLSTFVLDQGVWVVDKGAGQVVRLNDKAEIIARGSGLSLPHLIKTHQVID
ncbi:MAG: hypothetical protein GX801_06185, partial [Fibrobacter sp.]|nr:hypothetical protein [Fibrobacter sp.]